MIRLILCCITELLFLNVALADPTSDRPLSSLSDHEPHFKGRALAHESYVAVTAKRLKNAKVVWMNFNWLHENGIHVHPDGMSSEFEKQVLDAFAYMIPKDSQEAEANFLEKTKVLYSDRYGGAGTGSNSGSGRAASSGETQIKGVGPTPNVGKHQAFDHAHGGASIEEGMREAVWGEVNHRELPFGSNRIIAVIDTGTYTEWTNGGKERRALIVREDPLRPAHLLIEKSRPDEYLNTYLRTLVGPQVSDATLKKIAVETYVARVAKQYATAYVKRIYHGATSPSNIDFRGKFLDFGTETYLPSYQKIHVISGNEASGEIREIIKDVIDPLTKRLGMKSLDQAFKKTYQQTLHSEFIKLTGAPPHLVSALEHTLEYKVLSDVMKRFALSEHSKDRLLMDRKIPEGLKKTKMGEVLKWGAEHGTIAPALEKNSLQVNPKLREEFAKAYLEFENRITAEAESLGISKEAFSLYQKHATQVIHRDPIELMRPNQIQTNIALVDAYEHSENRTPIWDKINREIELTSRTPYGPTPFSIVLENHSDPVAGKKRQKIFDAKSNSEYWITVDLKPERPSFHSQNGCLSATEYLKQMFPQP